ncbi:putative sporulation protein YtxC [Tissierella sp. MB52-C2]|uniref:putative sporulation protein YtxC n=1 Tax=Tissierella sp. MB52-C2 TaxID=3070999 RepID=UPI00280C1EEF|nr:putative sporulation protein YtxC [Tissierella sp. MB52-C2]WMM23656.1 putative sporulation protein YtxC [Tissierella sp. MB52-C2]
MQSIKIGGNLKKDEVKNLINRYFSDSKVTIKSEEYQGRYEFEFTLDNKRNLEDIAFYRAIANLVQDIILEIYIKPIIIDRVLKICGDYSSEDKETIFASAHSTILNENYYIKEKSKINEEILNYIIENNNIVIDGFMNFRLRKYIYVLDISIEKSIGELEVEKEYQEFMNMLQYFVEIQEPKYELVNVIIKNNDYFLLDNDNNTIENGLLEYTPEEEFYKDISKADLLVSSLIVISPLKIKLHVEEGEEEELVSIISQVFGDKVEFCHGCEKCEIKTKVKKGK